MKYLLFLIAVIFAVDSCSQNLSVEFSVEWRCDKSDIYNKDSYIYKELDINRVPYLKIRYNNLSDTAIYFPKIYYNALGLPVIFGNTYPINYADPADRGKSLYTLSDKSSIVMGKSIVYMDDWGSLNGILEILEVSEAYNEEEYIISPINDLLDHVYDSLFDGYGYFRSRLEELQDDQILGELKDYFVFLAPLSDYVEYYNLSGFVLIGGDYSFEIRSMDMSDSIILNGLTATWDEQQKCYISKTAPLPKTIDGYHLYSGEFLSNKIEIEF